MSRARPPPTDSLTRNQRCCRQRGCHPRGQQQGRFGVRSFGAATLECVDQSTDSTSLLRSTRARKSHQPTTFRSASEALQTTGHDRCRSRVDGKDHCSIAWRRGPVLHCAHDPPPQVLDMCCHGEPRRSHPQHPGIRSLNFGASQNDPWRTGVAPRLVSWDLRSLSHRAAQRDRFLNAITAPNRSNRLSGRAARSVLAGAESGLPDRAAPVWQRHRSRAPTQPAKVR
jgi:hypothetical protein